MTRRLKSIRKTKMREQQGRCHYCGLPMWDDEQGWFANRSRFRRPPAALRCTAEHLQPRCEGGADVADNIVAACRFCNQARHRPKRPLSPEAHREHVRRRMAQGKWLAAFAMPAAGHPGGSGRSTGS